MVQPGQLGTPLDILEVRKISVLPFNVHEMAVDCVVLSGPLWVDSIGLADAPHDHVTDLLVQDRVALHGLQRKVGNSSHCLLLLGQFLLFRGGVLLAVIIILRSI